MKKLLLGLLAMLMTLTGCSSKTTEFDAEYDPKNYVDYITTEYSTLNYLTSWSAATFRISANVIDGLTEYNKYGQIVGALAKEVRHNDNYSVWTFKLREGVKWYTSSKEEYAEVTADDFVYAAEYILNPINGSYNVNSYKGVIEGATEYYEALSKGQTADFSTVGVKALDKYTVEYTMADGKGTPYFDSAATYPAYNPVNRQFVESLTKNDLGAPNFGIDKDHLLYCGPYILTECTLEQEKLFEKNENYWDVDNATFDTVKVLYFKDQEAVYEGFKRGLVSYTPLLSSTAVKLNNEKSPYLIQLDLQPTCGVILLNNQNMYSEDANTAMENINFRKSLFYGIDRTMYNEVSNPINPESIEGHGFSGTDFVYISNGTDYTQLGELAKYHDGTNYDLDLALDYKEKAMTELTTAGVTFPIKIIHQHAAGNETAANQARMLKEAIEALGTDYVEVEIEEYTNSSEMRSSGEYAIALGGWTPDWGDPVNNLTSLKSYSGTMNSYENITVSGASHWLYEEYDAMVDAADLITDKDTRYLAMAKAEAWLLDNAYVIPLYQNGGTYQLTTVNNYSKVHTGVGIDQFKWKGIEAYDHVITAEENATFKATWEAERAKALASK